MLNEATRQFVRYWIRDPLLGALFVTVHHGMRLLPIDACSRSGAETTRLTRSFYPESDRRARRLWQALHPEAADAAATDAAMDRLWRNVGRTMHEYSVIDRLWGAGRIAVEGMHHVDEARAQGRPILATPLHLGNWETVLIAGIAGGHPGSGIYLPPENRFEHAIVNAARRRYGARIVKAGPDSLRQALRELKAKRGPFIIFVDEFIRGRVQAPAFGRTLRPDSNIGYAVQLARRADAALIPAYCERIGDAARFKVHVLPPVELVANADRDAETRENMARLNAVIEPIVRAHIDQWYYALDFEFD